MKINKKQNKELKEALKNEVSPLLIGLRNEIKKTNDELGKLASKSVPVNELEIIFDGKKITALKGKDAVTPVKGKDYFDGYTPVKGKDYFTGTEIKSFLKQVTPVKGKHYFDGQDAYTPVKGKDYFTDTEIKDFLNQCTPIKGIHYRDGKDGVTKTVVEYVELDGIEVRDKLEELRGNARLSAKAIRGLDELIVKMLGQSGHGSSGGGGSGTEIPSQTGQSGKFLTTNGSSLSWATVSGSGVGAWSTPAESPAPDGSVLVYTVGSTTPTDVVADGGMKFIGIDYTFSGGQITFGVNSAPAGYVRYR